MKLVLSMVTGALLAGSIFAQGVGKEGRPEPRQKGQQGEVRGDRPDRGGQVGREKGKIARQQNKLGKRSGKQAKGKQTP